MALSDYITDSAEFISFGPEFSKAPVAMLDFFIEAAKSKINPTVFVEHTKLAHFYWAAHLIAMSPYGRNLRLESDDGVTDYQRNYEMILKTCGLTIYLCNADL